LSRGGDFAELFWERHETLQFVLDDGRIEDAIGSPTLVISELSIGGT